MWVITLPAMCQLERGMLDVEVGQIIELRVAGHAQNLYGVE